MNLDHLIQYAAERDAEQKTRADAEWAIIDAQRVLARTRNVKYTMDDESVTRTIVELAKRVVALEEKLAQVPDGTLTFVGFKLDSARLVDADGNVVDETSVSND